MCPPCISNDRAAEADLGRQRRPHEALSPAGPEIGRVEEAPAGRIEDVDRDPGSAGDLDEAAALEGDDPVGAGERGDAQTYQSSGDVKGCVCRGGRSLARAGTASNFLTRWGPRMSVPSNAASRQIQ